jgi:hypothetical protein
MNGELTRTLKKTVVACFKVASRDLRGQLEENHEKYLHEAESLRGLSRHRPQLNQMNAINTLQLCFPNIHFNIILPSKLRSSLQASQLKFFCGICNLADVRAEYFSNTRLDFYRNISRSDSFVGKHHVGSALQATGWGMNAGIP